MPAPNELPEAVLLPCPFCYCTVTSFQPGPGTSRVVRCEVCGATCGPSHSDVAAASNWNMRDTIPAGRTPKHHSVPAIPTAKEASEREGWVDSVEFMRGWDSARGRILTDASRARELDASGGDSPADDAGVRVPREVTPEMVLAFQRGMPNDRSFWGCYRAMLAAAPKENDDG